MTYLEAMQQAQTRSMQPDNRGCVTHVNAVIQKWNRETGEPRISGYTLSDWYGDTTVASWVNGEER